MERHKWFCMEINQPSIISTEPTWLIQLAELATTLMQPPKCPSPQLPSVSWVFVHEKSGQVWCLPDLITALRKRTQSLVSCRTSWVLLYHLSHVLLISSLLAMTELGHSHTSCKYLFPLRLFTAPWSNAVKTTQAATTTLSHVRPVFLAQTTSYTCTV